ncbi:Reverse transcriptase zinc-binding domain [Thalictrum thalictroides]|uniref:Reverse transcriptase zinc-binding domain n=1 Tax=Thalictrum thalictroides TaxID=46969 RepID=A0A7J6UXK9_THATH|nr:Reverse transcriptase zinc-binding domain [Thalictrum thalictroides]
MQLLQQQRTSSDDDHWCWTLEKNGKFTVSSFAEFLQQEDRLLKGITLQNFPFKLAWSNKLPPKIKFFVWTVLQGRLQTAHHLVSRGMVLNTICPLCHLNDETSEHLLLSCSVSKLVWRYFTADNINTDQFFAGATTVKDVLSSWPKRKKDTFGNQLWSYLPFAIIWVVWLSRNETVFRGKPLDFTRICNQIKGTLWFWIGGETKNPGHHFVNLITDWSSLVAL